MAALAQTVDTLTNWTKGRDPNGSKARSIELLNQSNEITYHIPWEQGNKPLGNTTTVNVSLPQVYNRMLGQAVPTSTSRDMQIDDAMSIFEAWNVVDCDLATLKGDLGAYRWSRAKPYFEAMTQAFCQMLFYGDPTQNQAAFYGFAPRYSTLNPANAGNAANVIGAGGTGSVNTSMWLINWGEDAVTGIFPEGTPAGLNHEDFGMVSDTVTAGYPTTSLAVYKDRYQWKCGLALKDWRRVVRVCNIDTTNLVNESNAADLIKLAIEATYQLPSIASPPSTTGNPMTTLPSGGMKAWYTNRTIRKMLHIQILNKTNNQLSWETVNGKKVMVLGDIPVYNVDQLLNNEATVS